MDKKISELDQALQINNDAVFPISQDNGGTDTTYKVSITQISSEVGEDQTFSNLQTTSKKLVGAINELYQGGGGGGSSTLDGLSDVDIDDQTLSDGQVLKYDSAEDKWINDDVGAGGHTIVADDGTDLAQRANLQFIGAYSEDNSVDDTTEVNVVRNMTKAQFDQLTADEKTGFINTTDEASQINATQIPITSGSATNTKDYIDTGLSGKANKTSAVQIATYSFSKTINATTQTTYVLGRGDFNLPANAVAVSVFLRENTANSVNAGGLVYSAYVNPTATNAVAGAIYNGTNASRTYSITATLLYTLT